VIHLAAEREVRGLYVPPKEESNSWKSNSTCAVSTPGWTARLVVAQVTFSRLHISAPLTAKRPEKPPLSNQFPWACGCGRWVSRLFPNDLKNARARGGWSQKVRNTHISAGIGAMSRPKLWKYLSREATDSFYATEDPDAQAAYAPDSHRRMVTPLIHLHPLQAGSAPTRPHNAHPRLGVWSMC
jgi:hypothetical protein